MSVSQFLSDLFEAVAFRCLSILPGEADQDTDEALMAAEKIAAANLAGLSPRFDLAYAQWAAKMFYGACHFPVCDINAETGLAFFKQGALNRTSGRIRFTRTICQQRRRSRTLIPSAPNLPL